MYESLYFRIKSAKPEKEICAFSAFKGKMIPSNTVI